MSRKIWIAAFLILVASLHPKTNSQSAQSQVQHREITVSLDQSATTENESETSILTPEIEVPLEFVEPFLAIAPMVTVASGEDQIILRYRFAQNFENWSEWETIVIDRDVSPRGLGKLSALLFVPKDTSKVQFQLNLSKDEKNFSPVISHLKVSFISPGITNKGNSNQLSPSKHTFDFSPESSTAKYPKPLIASRTDWGCPDGQGNPRATPSYSTVTHLIVHHTAGSNTSSDWAAVVRSIWNFHIFTNGWSDIGYNYLIDPNGVIYEGRAGGDNVVGAHFSCQNGATMGVALLGTFTSIQPNSAAMNSLKEILSWKADQRNIDPAGQSVHAGMQQSLFNISGHRDGNGLPRSCGSTECPGNSFYPTLPELRSETNALVNPANDFLLSSTTSKQVTSKGSTVNFPINSSIVGGSAQSISFSIRNLPSGLTYSFSNNSIVTGNTAQLSINVPENTPSGTYAITVIGTGSTKRALDFIVQVTGSLATVSAASYFKSSPVASESIVSAFGINLANETKIAENLPLPTSLADVSVKVKDSSGTELASPLFFVSPTQINYQLPPSLERGIATITVTNKAEIVAVGSIEISAISPGMFSANSNGQGSAIGLLQRRKADGSDDYEPLAQFDDIQKIFVPRPLDLRTPNEQYFLTLFGTGIRFRNQTVPIKAQIGGVDVGVLYAGEQREFVGLDQVNLQLPNSLIGRGRVEILITIEGKTTNPISVSLK